MTALRILTCAAAVTLSATAGWGADYYSPQQYYSTWQKAPSSNYAYRTYYYKPTPQYVGYKHHYVVLKDDHCYFYNPYEKKYWGRCPLHHNGKPAYSLLKPEHRRSSLAEIPESAFPPPGPLPPVPEGPDGGIVLDLPPDDLPSDIFVAQ